MVKKPGSVQEISEFLRLTGKRIGFVPTMGALHEGHVSLILNSSDICDVTFVSIFVNPSQFLPGEDFSSYPRDFKRDYYICEKAGANYIFYPGVNDMYGDNFLTEVMVKEISEKYEGELRPGHFTGVATVVLKLLNIVKPHLAFFGQKDAQQCIVIKKMVSDLNLDTQLIICPTIREDNGLALSSRNVYLNAVEKIHALVLHQSLELGANLILEKNVTQSDDVISSMKNFITANAPEAEIQYIAITDNQLMNPINDLGNFKGKILLSLGVKFPGTRLIDNVLLTK